MTPGPPPATLADLLAWRPPPGCRLVLVQDHDEALYVAVDACCASVSLGPEGAAHGGMNLHLALHNLADAALLERDRRHAAHPDACRGDVLAALAARGAEAVGAVGAVGAGAGAGR